MRNKYPGNCVRCGTFVAAREGHFERVSWEANAKLHHNKSTRWVVRCLECVGEGHTPPEKGSNEDGRE